MSVDLARRLKPSQLRLLQKISETGQLQTAAALTAQSQPAASRTLADLELLAGGPLFLRHAKGMEPTPLGRIFVRHAATILDSLDSLSLETQRFSAGETGHVRIGAVTGPAVGCLMPALHDIRADMPDVEVTVEVAPSTRLVRGLAENRFDFVISRLPPEYDSRDFRLHPARSEHVFLVVHPDHVLTRKRLVTLEDTLDHHWVIQELGSPIRQSVEAAFLTQDLPTPRQVTNSSSLLVVLSLLNNPGTIAPLVEEVAKMIASPPLSANVVVLQLNTRITVSPCFVIQSRFRPATKATERIIRAVLSRL